MIFTIDGYSFIKVIDKQNTMSIQKYGGHNLLMFATLVTLDDFQLLLSTQMITDLSPECWIFI